MALLWPLEGGRAAWPVYRGEQAHINDGEGPAWDLGNQEGLAVRAPADGVVATGTGNDPQRNDGGFHAGYVVVLACGDLRLHFCHLQGLEALFVGDQVQRGEIIGHVGHTGTTYDYLGRLGTPESSHLHLWTEQAGRRVWPSSLDWTDSDENPPQNAQEPADGPQEEKAVSRTAEQQQTITLGLQAAANLRQWSDELASLRHPEYSDAIRNTANQVDALRAALEAAAPE